MRRQRLLVILGVVLIAVALRMGLSQYAPITCPLRGLTGIPCASCGLTRAAAELCHGNFAAAFELNLASIPLAIFVAVLLLLLAWEAITHRPIVRPLWKRFERLFTWGAVVLFLTAWAVNLHRHFSK